MLISEDSINGKLIVNGKPVPGIVQHISINSSTSIDTHSSPSNKPMKVFRKYNEKNISITLKLFSTNELNSKSLYNQLREIEYLFKNPDNSSPIIHKVTHPHLQNRTINEMFLTSMSSSEDNSTDSISVSLNFEEVVAPPQYTVSNKE